MGLARVFRRRGVCRGGGDAGGVGVSALSGMWCGMVGGRFLRRARPPRRRLAAAEGDEGVGMVGFAGRR